MQGGNYIESNNLPLKVYCEGTYWWPQDRLAMLYVCYRLLFFPFVVGKVMAPLVSTEEVWFGSVVALGGLVK